MHFKCTCSLPIQAVQELLHGPLEINLKEYLRPYGVL